MGDGYRKIDGYELSFAKFGLIWELAESEPSPYFPGRKEGAASLAALGDTDGAARTR